MPFLFTVHVLPFLSTIEVLDVCVNQYQYWSGKERSRGKDVLTVPDSVRKAEGPVDHALYQNTYCLSFFAVE